MTPPGRAELQGDDHQGDDHQGDDHQGDDHHGDDHHGDDHQGDDHGARAGRDRVERATVLDRRRFLRSTGSLLAAAGATSLFGSLAGCGTRSAGPPSTTASTGHGPVDWSALSQKLTGTLVLPDDAAYATAKQLYNDRFDGIDPAAIAYCATAVDVQRCVGFARQHGVAVAARSGGHSYGGYSSTTGLVVDVSRLAAVVPGSGRATVGAGTLLIDLYDTLGTAGLLLPGGSCPTVGIAGLALGGGIGVFARKYGLTCDNIESVQMVTAAGELLTCDQNHHADLYWACRGGGGGNFGIATSFTFSVDPIPPVSLFTLQWPWAAAGEVLGAWLRWLPSAPDELWANCQLLSEGSAGGASGLVIKVTGVYAGQPAACQTALQPLLRAVDAVPTDNFVGPESYLRAMFIEAGCEGNTLAQCRLPSEGPQGILPRAAFAAKSCYLNDPLPPAGIDAVVSSVANLDADDPAVGGGMVFDAYGGAIGRVGAGDTAFVHRDALACVQLSVNWGPGASTSTVSDAQAWLSAGHASLSPYSTGAYQNYIDPELTDWQQAYYGANLPRLMSVKSTYDPDDFFHFAQSIPPG